MDAGYTITAHKYKLEQYGIPQARHLVIIVGFRNDLGVEFAVPAPTEERVTAGQAIGSIPTGALHQERTKQSFGFIISTQ